MLPATRRDLKKAGYKLHDLKTCQCGVMAELWTAPNGDDYFLNPMAGDDAQVESHFTTCARAAQFRRQRPADAEPPIPDPTGTRPGTPAAPSPDNRLSAARAAIQRARRVRNGQ